MPAGRCEHFRARFESGMRDAEEETINVPDGFTQQALVAALDYVYLDKLRMNKPSSQHYQAFVKALHVASYYGVMRLVVEALHVASYYGVMRLVSLCENALSAPLRPTSLDNSSTDDDGSSGDDGQACSDGDSVEQMDSCQQASTPLLAAAGQADQGVDGGEGAREKLTKAEVGLNGSFADLATHSDAGLYSPQATADLACQFLALSFECGLPRLKSISLDYVSSGFRV
eukprot:gene3386-13426_t